MHTFVETSKANRQTRDAGTANPTHSCWIRSHGARSVFTREHPTADNLAAPAFPGFANNLSRIPVYSSSSATLQPKLTIGSPADRFEKEAESTARSIMRLSRPWPQRDCACGGTCLRCRERNGSHEPIRHSQIQTGGRNGAAIPAAVHEVLRSTGRPLDSGARALFEPRFGYDFSGVRIYTGERAALSAQSIDAHAYTFGNRIVFGRGSYRPETSAGRELLAHELTHVVQQARPAGAPNVIQRSVASNSNCPANVHNAPADPLAELATVDTLAQNMALGASNVLFLESLTFSDPTFGRSYVFEAYRDWFGTPQQTPAGTWRSRFRTAAFATEEEAMAHEMQTLSERFRRIHVWLAGDIRYRCPGTGSFTIPGCRATSCGTDAAITCPTGSRTIIICPDFWVEPDPQDRAQAAVLIHEAIHPLFGFRAHGTDNVAQRGRNPGCYQGLALALFQTELTPGDCTPI